MAKLVSVFVNRATAGVTGAKRANDWGIIMIAIQMKGQMRGSQETKQECRASIGNMSFYDHCTLLMLDSIHPCSWRLAKTRPLNSAFEKVAWAAHSTPIKLAARRLKATRRPIKQ